MKTLPQKHGFTLLEILVALTIFAIIISAVYGSYFAAAQSADRCRTKIAQSRQARTLLDRMARQIRCCYLAPPQNHPAASENKTSTKIDLRKNPRPCLRGGTDHPDSIILHLTTTAAIYPDNDLPAGPFEAAYKYDVQSYKLYYHQQKFVPNSKITPSRWNWSLIAKNVAGMELSFFDGQRWLTSWNLKDKKSPPSAVKINLYLSDTNNNLTEFSTTAHIAAPPAVTVLLPDEK
ncbi:type II secretion system protein J [Planctomycetota bacterium]